MFLLFLKNLFRVRTPKILSTLHVGVGEIWLMDVIVVPRFEFLMYMQPNPILKVSHFSFDQE